MIGKSRETSAEAHPGRRTAVNSLRLSERMMRDSAGKVHWYENKQEAFIYCV